MNLAETNKAQGGGLTTAIVLVLMYFALPYLPGEGIPRPPVTDVVGALYLIATAVVGFVLGWVGVYFSPKNAPPSSAIALLLMPLAALLLLACSVVSTLDPWATSCDVYRRTTIAMTGYLEADRLTVEQAARYDAAKRTVAPICEGTPPPTGPAGQATLDRLELHLQEMIRVKNEVM